MRLYARPSWMLVRQVVADLFVVTWAVACWLVGRLVDATIRAIAEPSRQLGGALRALRINTEGAAGQVGGIPVVGEGARVPFDEMVRNIDGMITSADQQVATIEQAATLTGALAFLVPLLLVLVIWLPWRVRFAKRSAATIRLLDAPHGNDLLALRALATQPLRELLAVSPDPVGDWRAGDSAVTDRLAELELARAGVRRRAASSNMRSIS